MNLIT